MMRQVDDSSSCFWCFLHALANGFVWGMRAESCSLDLQQKSQMPSCSSNTSFEHFCFSLRISLFFFWNSQRSIYNVINSLTSKLWHNWCAARWFWRAAGFSREWKGPIHSSRQIKLCDDDDNVIIILFYKIMVLVCRLDLMWWTLVELAWRKLNANRKGGW